MMKKNKKQILFIFLIISIIGISLPKSSYAENKNETLEYATENNLDIFEDISAPNLLLAETNSGKILYERNIDNKIYPASITKLLTAILILENCELDEIVTVSESAVTSVPSGYVNANLQVGEEMMVEDLLYVMLIPSANDAANALAEHVAGSIESFASMMNTKAKELGCTGSNFTNPSGLHEEEHYTTTRDLYFISKNAIENDIIKKIVGTTTYTLPSTNKYSKTERIFTTTNYMKRKNLSKYYCDYCIGGKTGYTGDAKNCVVEFAKKDGIELIAIVMGEDSKISGKKFLDAKEMFEYVFKHYENKQVAIENGIYETIKISNGTQETKNLDILYCDNVHILANEKSNLETIEKNVDYTKTKAPIQKGEIVGKITYQYDGVEYSTDLIAGESVEESKMLKYILYGLAIMLFIYIIHNYKKSNRKHGKKSKRGKAKRIYY